MAKRTPRAGEGRGEGGGGVKEVRRGSVDYWTKGREKSEATVNMFTAGSAIFFFGTVIIAQWLFRIIFLTNI